MEALIKIVNDIYGFDLFYLIVTILSLIKCSRKGFVLSILAASKWLLAYVLTLFSFPKIKPYVSDIIDNEYVLDIILGVSIFVIIIFDRFEEKQYFIKQLTVLFWIQNT